MGLGAHSKVANGRLHTSILSPLPLQMGHLIWRLSMMTLWVGFKQQNFVSDKSIGLNEEEGQD